MVAANMELMETLANDSSQGHRFGTLVRIVEHYYNEPHRAYHGWNHIKEGAKFALLLAEKSDEFVLNIAQQLAWLFHDIVYIPGAANGQNEYASAAMLDLIFRPYGGMLSQDLCENLPQKVLDDAKRTILTTVHHSPGNPKHMPICDLDLLGFHDPFLFERNNNLLFDEFAVSPRRFEFGQVKFLTNLLSRSHIYSTQYARENWEQPARDNIKRFINSMLEKHPELQEQNKAFAVSPA